MQNYNLIQLKFNMQEEIIKCNDRVCFRESDHVYYLKDNPTKRLTSVTQVYSYYKQPFDKEFWSFYKALESFVLEFDDIKASLLKFKTIDVSLLTKYDIDEEEFSKERQLFIDKWDENKDKSCIRGTNYHQIQEDECRADAAAFAEKLGIGKGFVLGGSDIDLSLSKALYPEIILDRVSDDGIFMLAGQSDLVIVDDGYFDICDYKTGSKIDMKAYYNRSKKSTKKMKYPLMATDDCNFMHYTLQLSTYAWMIEKRYPELKCRRLWLRHWDHDGNMAEIECKYMKRHVEETLKHFKVHFLKNK